MELGSNRRPVKLAQAAFDSNVEVHKSTHIGEILICTFNLSYVRIIPREVK